MQFSRAGKNQPSENFRCRLSHSAVSVRRHIDLLAGYSDWMPRGAESFHVSAADGLGRITTNSARSAIARSQVDLRSRLSAYRNRVTTLAVSAYSRFTCIRSAWLHGNWHLSQRARLLGKRGAKLPAARGNLPLSSNARTARQTTDLSFHELDHTWSATASARSTARTGNPDALVPVNSSARACRSVRVQ